MLGARAGQHVAGDDLPLCSRIHSNYINAESTSNGFFQAKGKGAPPTHGGSLNTRRFRLPYGLITGVEYWSEQTGPTFLARDPYRFLDEQLQQQFSELRRHLTYNTYHALKALKDAVDELKLTPEDADDLKQRIFAKNAQSIVAQTETPLPGPGDAIESSEMPGIPATGRAQRRPGDPGSGEAP